MDIVIWIFTVFATFIVTEFTAWFNHKYLMHGPLWILHKDHHKKIIAHGLKEMICSFFSTPF